MENASTFLCKHVSASAVESVNLFSNSDTSGTNLIIKGFRSPLNALVYFLSKDVAPLCGKKQFLNPLQAANFFSFETAVVKGNALSRLSVISSFVTPKS